LEWIWVARLLSMIAFASAGIMRLTLSSADLAMRGDWTLGRFPLEATGSLLLGAALMLMLPRRRAFLLATVVAGLGLAGFEAASLYFLAQGGTSLAFDGIRLVLVGVVLWDGVRMGIRRSAGKA
jgi:hypothetical protein